MRAGPVRAFLSGGELRYVCIGGVEILRRVYVAVRDRFWRTVPAQITILQSQIEEDKFYVAFAAAHQEREIDFRWHGKITGGADGTINFTMEGEAQSTFLRNRIGICVLYPAPDCAGRPCRVEHPDGAIEDGFFPQLIAPHQPFKNIRAIAHDVLPGLKAEVRLEGEVFEMEDQRNWTDGSYKVYGTPLDLPFPVEVPKGERISQSFRLTLEGDTPAAPNDSAAAISVSFAEDFVTRLPSIGLGAASTGELLGAGELGRLRQLNLSHLRIDLKLQKPDYKVALAQGAREARGVGAGLELALFLSDKAASELRELRRDLERLDAPVARILVFRDAEKVTARKWVESARDILGPKAIIGAGTNHYFAELNRNRPLAGASDLICYSINPQVHATDEDALVEALAAQAATVENARQFVGGTLLAITPVTLKPRFNPHVADGEVESEPGRLPAAVDARQMSLFAAAWTLGSLKYLAESGAQSVTYYETAGWRGVMESERGSPEPELFPSMPGSVYPLWHVLADAGEFAGADVIRTHSSEPLKVATLALRRGEKLRLMVANLTGDPQTVSIEQHDRAARIRRLNASNLRWAISEPEKFRERSTGTLNPAQGGQELQLMPDEIVTLDYL